MITEWLMSLGVVISETIAGIFEPIEVPDWMIDSTANLVGFVNSASGLGVWVPWEALGLAAALLTVVFVVTFGAKLVRAIAAHIPFLGGAG